MKRRSRRYKQNFEKINGKTSVDQALKALMVMTSAKFDETVEAHFKLNLKVGKSNHQVRFSTDLPHGTGKTPKIAVFAEGEKVKEAKAAGADFIYAEKEIQAINDNGKIEFEIAVATPSMMPKLARIAKILGPKNLMPNPKSETVTEDIKGAVEQLKKGKINIKNDKTGVVHQALGKVSFGEKKLIENYNFLLDKLEKQRPDKLKGKFIQTKTITTTMSPGIRVS